MGDHNSSVTEEEIKRYIEQIGVNEKLCKIKYEVTPGSEAGDNYVGILHRIRLTCEGEDGQKITKSLIYKSQPESEARRKQFLTDVFFNNEAVFYNDILPELIQFQKEKGLQEMENLSSFPTKCYHAGDVLILDDMRPCGFIMRDRRVSLDGAHCLLVVKEIGKLHAISFALRDQKPEKFKRLRGLIKETLFLPLETGSDQSMVEHLDNNCTKAIDEFMETTVVTDKEKYELKVKQFQRNYYQSMVDAVNGENAEPYAVINHGDCWTNNILFKYKKDSSIPEELCFIDFQLARYSSPVTDLAYFIYCCTDQDTRKEHYDTLMTEYHKSLSQFLKTLGSDPEKLFPFSVFQAQLKKFSKFGFGMALITLPLFTSQSEDLLDLNQISEDAHTGNSQTNTDLLRNTTNNNCLKRMNGVIEDIVNKGYIP